MPLDERYKLSQKIMEEVLTEIEESRDDPGGCFDFKIFRWEPPEGFEKTLFDNTHLFYELDSESVGIDLRFFTEGTAISLLHRSTDNLEKFLANITVIDGEGQTHKLGEIAPPALRSRLLEDLTKRTILRVIFILKDKIEDVVEELVRETELLEQVTLLSAFEEELKGLGVVDYSLEFIIEEYERIIAETVANKRSSLKSSFKNLWLPNLEEIGEHYNRVLPMWQDAKLLYRQNKERPTWKDIIKAAHPDLKEFDDLISRLSGRLSDLPETIQAKLSEKGGDAKPSSIALEHAARLCGAVPYDYGVRYLYYILRKYNNSERDEYP